MPAGLSEEHNKNICQEGSQSTAYRCRWRWSHRRTPQERSIGQTDAILKSIAARRSNVSGTVFSCVAVVFDRPIGHQVTLTYRTMPTFEDIKPGSRMRGLDPSGIAEVVQVAHFGPDALNLVFRVNGRVGERLVYRGEESGFDFLDAGRTYAFDADGGLLRLASEAYRIRLAYLFDPYLAVSASQIEALPHQITAVYGEMLPRQPLRFLLADDPGAGKTIMAGLLIKELLIRGDLDRCLIVAPGSLVEQPNSSALGASSSQRHVPAGPRRDVQPVHLRLDQLLQPLLQDAVASDPEEDRSLCHPLGAPQVQADASEDQGSARLV